MKKKTNRLYRFNKKTKKNKLHYGGRRYVVKRKYFYPGEIYDFDKNNMKDIDFAVNKVPLIINHTDKKCPSCISFKKTWNTIENRLNGNPLYSVANLIDSAAINYMNDKYYSKHGLSVNQVPTVVVFFNQVPSIHTGLNTLSAIETFLKKHGLVISVTKEQYPLFGSDVSNSEPSFESEPSSYDSVDSNKPSNILNNNPSKNESES
jgi:hypothetical protein